MITPEKATQTIEEESVTLPPDPERVVEGLRDTGYSFETSIADIVDNSIAANATKIDINVQMDPSGELTVFIADNGDGMDFEGLQNAMKYGSKRRDDPSSLGKFGLGLKTASTAFCRALSVVSRSSVEDTVRKVQWDLDYVARINQWKLKIPTPTEDDIEVLDATADGKHGTLVIWEKIDRLLRTYTNNNIGNRKNALKRVIQSLKFHLSMVYQRFLDPNDKRARDIAISLNGTPIEAWDPFCTKEPQTELLVGETAGDVDVELPDHTVASFSIRAYMLPRREDFSSPATRDMANVSNDLQGFYVYRENRLIHYGDWLNMFSKESHGSLLRVEFSFDHALDDVFNVDIKKSRILLNTDIFDYIKNKIMPYFFYLTFYCAKATIIITINSECICCRFIFENTIT